MTDLPSSTQIIPFSRSPLRDRFFEVGAYAEALARLQLMVSNSGLGVLTGEVGSGKSTLVRRLGHKTAFDCRTRDGITREFEKLLVMHCF